MGCITVNEPLLENVPPALPAYRKNVMRRLFMAPCHGRPSQDFVMPDQRWIFGCGGAIRWAVDPQFHLRVHVGEAVLIKTESPEDDFELWYVHFWERGWILTAGAQIITLRACSGVALLLLMLQALRLLRALGFALKLFVDACLNSRMGTLVAVRASARCCAARARQLFRGISKEKDNEVVSLYNARRVARVQYAMWVMQPVMSLVLLGNFHRWQGEMIWSVFSSHEQCPFCTIHSLSRALASTGLFPCVALFAWATFFHVCPQLLSARTLDVSHVAIMATWAFQFGVLRQKARTYFYDTLAWMDIMHVLTAVLIGNAALATPLQVLLAAVHIHFHIQAAYNRKEFFSNTEVTNQLAILILFLAFIWLMDWQSWREAEATVKAKQADNSCSMVT